MCLKYTTNHKRLIYKEKTTKQEYAGNKSVTKQQCFIMSGSFFSQK